MIIRHDDGRDDDDSNNSNSYKSKACCSEVVYIIRYLFIGAEGGNIDSFPLLSITLRAFVAKQPYVAARSVYIVTATIPMPAPSKASVCVCSLAGIAGSNHAEEHGCLSLVSVVCCQIGVCAKGRSLVQRSPTECGVSECDRKASIMRRPWPNGCCCGINL